MTLELALLIIVAYLVGALPLAYLAAKWAKGIDLRSYGTGQVGFGNLARMTSRKVAVPVGIFDLAKSGFMVWLAALAGLNTAQGIAVGLAAIAGHNWPVFLRFKGGRGVLTAIGFIVAVPLVNGLPPWPAVVFFGVAFTLLGFIRSTPLPALCAFVAIPIATLLLKQPLEVTLGFVALLLLVVAGRLLMPLPAGTSTGKVLVMRLLYDRDMPDKKAWMHRKPGETAGTKS